MPFDYAHFRQYIGIGVKPYLIMSSQCADSFDEFSEYDHCMLKLLYESRFDIKYTCIQRPTVEENRLLPW